MTPAVFLRRYRVELRCPNCQHELEQSERGAHCSACHQDYRVEARCPECH